MSKGTEFRRSRNFSILRRVLWPSRCFERAAVSGNLCVSFLEEADMDANRNNSKKMLEAAIDAVRSSEPDRMDMENRAARVWSRIGQEFQEREKTNDPNFSSVPKFTSCSDYRALIPD